MVFLRMGSVAFPLFARNFELGGETGAALTQDSQSPFFHSDQFKMSSSDEEDAPASVSSAPPPQPEGDRIPADRLRSNPVFEKAAGRGPKIDGRGKGGGRGKAEERKGEGER